MNSFKFLSGLFFLSTLFLDSCFLVNCSINEISLLPSSENGNNLSFTSEELTRRAEFVKNMTINAWNSYKRHSWGLDFLQPLSPSSTATSANPSHGQTIIHSLSTLWVMNLTSQFERAREWIEKDYQWAIMQPGHIGPLLSAYALSNDSLFLEKAQQIAERMLPNDLQTEEELDIESSAKIQLNSLAFQYLSQLKGNASKYWAPIERNYNRHFKQEVAQTGEHPFAGINRLRIELKRYLLENNATNWQALTTLNWTLSTLKSTGRLTRAGEREPRPMYIRLRERTQRMRQSDCSYAPLFALASATFTAQGYHSMPPPGELLQLAEAITATCKLATTSNAYGLPPDYMDFSKFYGGPSAAALISKRKAATIRSLYGYNLNPYLAEAYFILYRVSGNELYRQYAWELTRKIHQHCREGQAFVGIFDLFDRDSKKIDKQSALFFSATLKYLYLINLDSSIFPLAKWVFTLGGHPFPVKVN